MQVSLEERQTERPYGTLASENWASNSNGSTTFSLSPPPGLLSIYVYVLCTQISARVRAFLSVLYGSDGGNFLAYIHLCASTEILCVCVFVQKKERMLCISV